MCVCVGGGEGRGTHGWRQAAEALDGLLAAAVAARDALPPRHLPIGSPMLPAAAARAVLRGRRHGTRRRPPLLVKIAPELSDTALEGVVSVCAARGVEGIIVSNTTSARPATLQRWARARCVCGARALTGMCGRARAACVVRGHSRACVGTRALRVWCEGIHWHVWARARCVCGARALTGMCGHARSEHKGEVGGLSGAPLLAQSTDTLSRVYVAAARDGAQRARRRV